MKKIFYLIVLTIVYLFCSDWIVVSQNFEMTLSDNTNINTVIHENADFDATISDIELFRYYWIWPILLDIHKELWMWVSDDEISYSYSSLIQNMRYYADIDIMQYLGKTVYPQLFLDNFLERTESLINISASFIIYLEEEKNKMVKNKNSCDDAKTSSDKNFSLALKDLDSVNMEKYLLLSIESEKCSVESRIYYNAYDKMQSQVKYYYNILWKKYDYFYKYKYDILEKIVN